MRIVRRRIDGTGREVKMSANLGVSGRTSCILPLRPFSWAASPGRFPSWFFTRRRCRFFSGSAWRRRRLSGAVVPPFNAPMVVSITFWGAVYGGLFGLLAPRFATPNVVKALVAGLFAVLMGWFVVRPLADPLAFGWQTAPMLRSAAACFMWGIGVTLILPLLHPAGSGAPRRWDRHHLAYLTPDRGCSPSGVSGPSARDMQGDDLENVFLASDFSSWLLRRLVLRVRCAAPSWQPHPSRGPT